MQVGVQNSANVLLGILKVLDFSVQFPDFSPRHHSPLDAAGTAGRDIAYRTVADCIGQYGQPRVMTDSMTFCKVSSIATRISISAVSLA